MVLGAMQSAPGYPLSALWPVFAKRFGRSTGGVEAAVRECRVSPTQANTMTRWSLGEVSTIRVRDAIS